MGEWSKRDWAGEAVGWLVGARWSPRPFSNVFNQRGPLFCSAHQYPQPLWHRFIPIGRPSPCEFQGRIEPRAWYPYFAEDSTAADFY